MKRLMLIATLALAVTACGGDSTASTAPAPTTTVPARLMPGADAAIGSVQVTVSHPSIDPIVYTLDCFGDTFTVTPAVPGIDAAAACARFGDPAVIDRLVLGPPAGQICTEIYGGEDVAVLTGTIDDEPINATIDRTNGCGIADWDTLLAGILPPAIGVTS